MTNPSRSLDQRSRAQLGQEGKGYGAWIVRGARDAPVPVVAQAWQGAMAVQILPPLPAALEAVSSAAADDSLGTGARFLKVWYLNARFELRLGVARMLGVITAAVTEFDVVTGVSNPLNPVLDCIRVLYVQIAGVGSGGQNAGRINVTVASVEQITIPTPPTVFVSDQFLNMGQSGAFTVPLGFCALLDVIHCDPITGGLSCFVQAQRPGFPFTGQLSESGARAFTDNGAMIDPIAYGPGTDLRVMFQQTGSPGAGTVVIPRLDLYLAPSSDPGAEDQNPEQIPNFPFSCAPPQGAFGTNPLPPA